MKLVRRGRLSFLRSLFGKAQVPPAPPRFLFLTVNQRCNLRCRHCAYWKQDDSDRARYLTREQRRAIIREFAAMSPGAAVVICGGESMLDPEAFFDVAATSRHAGLRCLAVVNGTCIRNEDMANRMIREGPTEISISLNSHIESIHDETRGVPGAFRMATQAVRLVRAAREQQGAATRLYVMALVHEGNYCELDGFYDFVLRDLRADKLKLNFIQPTFGGSDPDEFFEQHHIRDARALLAVIRACDVKYGLNLSAAWMAQVQMYVESVSRNRDAIRGWHSETGTVEHICNSYERNIMVDLYGQARLCFSTAFPGRTVRKPGELRRFWFERSAAIRTQMRCCNRYCGISHSVRRENATSRPDAPACGAAGDAHTATHRAARDAS